MLVFFILFYNILEATQPCIYPSFYWVNNNYYKNKVEWPLIDNNQYTKTEDFTQCGITWPKLLDLDFIMVKEKNILWLLLFQHYSLASLNNALLKKFFDSIPPEKIPNYDNDLINDIKNKLNTNSIYLLKAFSILDNYCNKMADLNFIGTKDYIIDLVKNISLLNSGKIVDYCDDLYTDLKIPNYDDYTLFYNETYKDKSIYNSSLNISLKPLYYDDNNEDIQKQYIYSNWVMNITIDKRFALSIVISITLMGFLMLILIAYFGPFTKNADNEANINRSSRISLLRHNCTFCFKRIFCCCIKCYSCIHNTIERNKYKKMEYFNDDNTNTVDLIETHES